MIERFKNEFDLYVSNFDMSNSMINRKYYHSYRVMELTNVIGSKIDNINIDIMMFIGLYHDLGRFIQAKDFNTFNDSLSFDHAKKANDILFDDNFILKMNIDNKYYSIIKDAIYYHNKLELDSNINKDSLEYAKVIRDADKIDILRLVIDKNISINDKINDKIYKDFLDRKLIKKEDVITKIDIILLQLGFIFDINYIESYKIIKNENLINRVIDSLVVYEIETKNELEKIRNILNNYIDKRIGEENVR